VIDGDVRDIVQPAPRRLEEGEKLVVVHKSPCERPLECLTRVPRDCRLSTIEKLPAGRRGLSDEQEPHVGGTIPISQPLNLVGHVETKRNDQADRVAANQPST
jgi:hypothetical protein